LTTTTIYPQQVIRDRTEEELRIENAFLVAYIIATRAVVADKWTGRGPDAMLSKAYFGAELSHSDLPYSAYEYDTVVRFMQEIPEHLKEVLQSIFEEVQEYWFIRKEEMDRRNTLSRVQRPAKTGIVSD
jgi:hypothetical protein